jgi:outer membrane protein assembly factor BamA
VELQNLQAHISRLLGSIFYDRRDNALDTRKGWFHSTSAEFGPEWLGSSAGYRKYLNQDFFFLPLGPIISASAARVEYSSGSGQFFITSERLQAGGSTTVRGYDDISVSLLTELNTGRTSLAVLNQELRFPLFRRFQAATFIDHASLFGDYRLPVLTKERTSAGVGVRFVLPFILFRVDYGYPLKQDPVNNHGRWYFAIGQAF